MVRVHYPASGTAPPTLAGHVVVGVCGWCVPVIRVGGYSGGVTPGPIPNPEAKPTCADGTAPGRVWESRSLPANNLFVWSVVSADSLCGGWRGPRFTRFWETLACGRGVAESYADRVRGEGWGRCRIQADCLLAPRRVRSDRRWRLDSAAPRPRMPAVCDGCRFAHLDVTALTARTSHAHESCRRPVGA